MRRKWSRPGLSAVLLGLVLAASAQAAAQGTAGQQNTAQAGLAAEEMKAIEAAAGRDDAVTIRSIVIAAIARDSSKTTAVVADAVRIAPGHAETIVDAVSAVFPRLEERASEAAGELAAEKEEIRAGEAAGSRRAVKRLAAPDIAFSMPNGPSDGPGPKWSGETAVGGTYQNASSESVAAGFSSKIVWESGRWKHFGEFDFDYGRVDGDTNTRRLNIGGKTRRTLSDRFFALALLNYENDRFSGFDYQATEGVGLGYRVFDSPTFTLDLEGGPTLRQSRVEETAELDQEFLGRVAVNLDWQMTDTASFTNETAVFVSKDAIDVESASTALIPDSSETRNVSAVDVDIFGNLSARLSYELSYRSDPPPGGRGTNSLGKISLIHSF